MTTTTGDRYDELLRRQAARRNRSLAARLSVLPGAVALVYRAAPVRSVLVLALEAFSSILAAGQVVAAAALVRGLLSPSDRSATTEVVWPLLGLGALAMIGGVLGATSPRAERLLGEHVSRGVWDKVLAVASKVPLVAYDTSDFSEVLERVRQHGITRPTAVATSLARLLGGALTTVTLVGFLITVHWSLPLLAMLAGLPSLLTSRKVGNEEFTFARSESPGLRRRYYLADLLMRREHAKEVRSFALGPWLRGQYDQVYRSHIRSLSRHLRSQASWQTASAVLTGLLTSGLLLVLVLFLDRGVVELPQAAGAVVALRMLASRVSATASAGGGLYQNGLFLEDLQAFLAYEVVEEESAGGDRGPGPGSPAVELRSVSFTYPGAERPSLHDINLELVPGRVTALVGENGSGKTTLAKVVAQLYGPTAGAVSWNGQVVVSAERPRLREQIAVLFQDFGQYFLSAEQNVTTGRIEAAADTARRDRAIRTAGAEDVVSGLPQGWQTMLAADWGGQDLSRGQWQRIALARAHFREADVVVLDEPTAALDPRAEARLFDDIRSVLRGKTVLLITHRLTSARTADAVVVLDKGRIVERGTHDSLLAQNGVYAELWRIQAAGYGASESRV